MKAVGPRPPQESFQTMRASAAPCIEHDIELASKTSMGVGGTARRYASPGCVEEFRELFVRLRDEGSDPFILGGGFNTIFPDGRFDRPVLHTARLRGSEVRGRTIRAEAGVRLKTLIQLAAESGLAGLERFHGIPGTVGGAIAMNAGGSGCEFGQLVRTVRALDPASKRIVDVPAGEISWGYRSTDLRGLIVVGAELELVEGDRARIRRAGVEFMRWKAASQPLGSHNAGCMFRNPTGHSAGWLIERAGLKGRRVGAAVVSPKHGNFIINERGRALARDVLSLIDIVRRTVKEFFDVDLELEVVFA